MAITAGAKFVEPAFAALIGLVGGMVVVLASRLLVKLRIDDAVDAVPVHGFCGLGGTIATGMFQTGHLFDPQRLGVQATGALVAAVWAFATGWLVFKLVDLVMGLRVSTEHEQRGLDYSNPTCLDRPL